MIVMKRGDWKIWGFGAAVVFGLLWFVDFLFALAGVSFLIEWFTVEQLSSESARASAITAAVGLIGGVGALVTFLFNYQQKQQQFENSQDLSRKQHEYEMIFREYSELSRDFASDHELSRINAAINLVRIAKLPDPRFDDERSRREGDRNWILEKYPWFKSTCLQMATASISYSGVVQQNAIVRAIEELAQFAGNTYVSANGKYQNDHGQGTNFQPLLEFLIRAVGGANKSCFELMKRLIAEIDLKNAGFPEVWEYFSPLTQLGINHISDYVESITHLDFRVNGEKRCGLVSREVDKRRNLENICSALALTVECFKIALVQHRRYKENFTTTGGSQEIELNGIFLGGVFSNLNFSFLSFSSSHFHNFKVGKCGAIKLKMTRSEIIDSSFTESDLRDSEIIQSQVINTVISDCNCDSMQALGCAYRDVQLYGLSMQGMSFGETEPRFFCGSFRLSCNWGKADFRAYEPNQIVLPTGEYKETQTCYTNRSLIIFLMENSPYFGMLDDLRQTISAIEFKKVEKIFNARTPKEFPDPPPAREYRKCYSADNPDWWKD